MPLPVEEEDDSSVDENEILGEFDYDGNNNNEYGNSKPKIPSQKSNMYEDPIKTNNEEFLDVISDMVMSGQADGHSPDNLLMEIKGYKFAQNKVFIKYVPITLLLNLLFLRLDFRTLTLNQYSRKNKRFSGKIMFPIYEILFLHQLLSFYVISYYIILCYVIYYCVVQTFIYLYLFTYSP